MTEQDPPAPPGQLPKYLAEGLPKQDNETLAEAREYIEELLAWRVRPVEEDVKLFRSESAVVTEISKKRSRRYLPDA
ncbi:hypothetical protein [Halococcus sediminicola]|uniref:hypothetical protein n=1 Tax=Halococcus sediminicola TaxID=1264579 RepID=UPI0012AB42B5|nr:hypothetical protein [Halococcus sediminicola]